MFAVATIGAWVLGISQQLVLVCLDAGLVPIESQGGRRYGPSPASLSMFFLIMTITQKLRCSEKRYLPLFSLSIWFGNCHMLGTFIDLIMGI